MKVAIGTDHVGFGYKKEIMEHLTARGVQLLDCGPDSGDRCDYPIYGEKVARAIQGGQADLGVLICGTGIGISLAANKVPGIRAAVCSESYSAAMARAHNNAHIICFGARVVGMDVAKQIVDAFFDAQFEGGRHQTRVDLITAIDEKR